MKEASMSSYGEQLAATVGTVITVLPAIITDTVIADKARLSGISSHRLPSIPKTYSITNDM